MADELRASDPRWADPEYWKETYESEETGLDEPFADQPWTSKTSFAWATIITPVEPGLGSPSGFWSIFPEPMALMGALRYVLLPDWFGAWLERDSWDEDPDSFLLAEELFARAEAQAQSQDQDPEKLAQGGVLSERMVALPFLKELIAALDGLLAGGTLVLEEIPPGTVLDEETGDVDSDTETPEGETDTASPEVETDVEAPTTHRVSGFDALRLLIDRFNLHFSGTGSWEFGLGVYDSVRGAAAELLDRRCEYLGDAPSEPHVAEALGMPRDAWYALAERSLEDSSAREDFLELLEEDSF